MKKFTTVAAVAMSAIILSFNAKAQATWGLDKAHSKLGFSITHLSVSDVDGAFKTFDATITTKGADLEGATLDFTADAASITTDNDARDKHVKSPDFMDVEKFTTVTFKSTSITKRTASTYKIAGNLTLHGVTKPVVLDAFVRMGTNPMSKKEVAGLKVSGIIKRADFGIGAKFGAAMLSDEITLNANGEFGKK
jgi:polyisoprenoid-binding protein YceI